MSFFLLAGYHYHGLHEGAVMELPAAAVLLCALCSLPCRSSWSSVGRPTSSHHASGQEYGPGQRVRVTSKRLSLKLSYFYISLKRNGFVRAE